ncbi:MAG TPA: peptide chain release factor 1 [Candidatus Omnitrophota bacterium]|nr:peptide chain release factor 1 [Candidatus Omnitrophota bacterium]HPS36550.1 peptide chain release factor 1 [Candidatus Omnitrophota bacterium]
MRERLEKTEERFCEIESLLAAPEAMRERNQFQKLSKEMARLRPIVEGFRQYRKIEAEIAGLKHSLAESQGDPAMKSLIEEEVKALEQEQAKRVEDLEGLFLRDMEPNAARDVIVEIRAGTGGEEAALFAADLFRMYSMYAGNHGLKVEVIDANPTGIGGFKEIIFGVTGQYAYNGFKYESGIHRVQRVPRTEASGRIHTSAVTVAVLPEVEEEEIEIVPSDLKIDVYRASGAGGQHVNKTESAVRITHLPTGFVVACQDERSQLKNKTKAMRILRAKIFEFRREQQEAEVAKNRKEQVGSGDRSGKIRTYNYPDNRVTDHRIGLTLYSLNQIMDGRLDPVVEALGEDEKARILTTL